MKVNQIPIIFFINMTILKLQIKKKLDCQICFSKLKFMEGGKYIGLHPAKNKNKKKSFLGVIFEVFLKNSKTGSLKILSKNQN